MQSGHVFLDNLDTSNGKRPLNDERVTVLMESIKELGLQQPIHIWAPDDDTVRIVAGRHRAEACRRLGWDEIPCVFVEMDEIDRERWEIAENLHRAELTKLERGEHIKRWIFLTNKKEEEEKEKRAQAAQGSQDRNIRKVSENSRPGRPGNKSAVARDLGIDEKTVRDGEQIAGLSDDAKQAAAEIGLDDNQSALLAASRETESAAQVSVLKNWKARKPVSPPEEPLNDIERLNKWKAKAVALLNEAPCPEARDWLRELLDQPVMDARYA